MENGLWLKSICRFPRCSSYIGKSVIQQKRNAPFSTTSFEFLAELERAPRPANGGRPPACRRRRTPRRRRSSPSTARSCSARSGPRLRAIGPAPSVRSEEDIAQAAAGPRPAPSRSSCRRSCAAAAARRRDRPDPGIGVAWRAMPREEPEARAAEDARSRRVMTMGLRRSGLSRAVFQHRLVVGDARERRLASPRGPRRIPRTRRRSPARSRRTRPPA